MILSEVLLDTLMSPAPPVCLDTLATMDAPSVEAVTGSTSAHPEVFALQKQLPGGGK